MLASNAGSQVSNPEKTSGELSPVQRAQPVQLQVEADTKISGDSSIIAQLERTRRAVHISKARKGERGRGDMNRQQQGKVHPVQAGGLIVH